jgi:phosphoglycerol transferase MdoB-like AlkP superfamily enzyme
MDTLYLIIVVLLPLALLVALFAGIVKNNKRLWIASLIFLIIILLMEFAYFGFGGSFKTSTTEININAL